MAAGRAARTGVRGKRILRFCNTDRVMAITLILKFLQLRFHFRIGGNVRRTINFCGDGFDFVPETCAVFVDKFHF